MSDSSESDYSPLPTTNLPVVPKKKRVTEKQRAVLLISATKARAAKAAKRKALDDTEAENANILRQVLEREKSKKADVIVVATEPEPVKTKRKSKKQPEPESEEEDSGSDASESDSDSNDEAEFVLTRSKHEKPKRKSSKTSADVSILEEMLRMKAELAALKQKKKTPKVNVYVNNAEKKKDLSTQKKKALMDL